MSLVTPILIGLLMTAPVDTVRLDSGTYIGEMPYGEGKLYHNEYGLFIGMFNRTLPSGPGRHFDPNGTRYTGNFVKGMYQGSGRLFMASGAVVCGEFFGGRANGRDTLYYTDGKVFIGIMQNGGATSQGKTYRSQEAAGVRKPAFPDIDLDEEDRAFLERLRKDGSYDTPAIFKDGVSFFQAYILPHFRFTESMGDKSALVHYEFVVGEDGKVRDVVITSSTDEDYARELERVIKHSPRWTPAMKDGKPVPYPVKDQKALFNMPQ